MVDIKKILEKLRKSKSIYSKECENQVLNNKAIIHFSDEKYDSTAQMIFNNYKVRFEINHESEQKFTYGGEDVLNELGKLDKDCAIYIITIYCLDYSYSIYIRRDTDELIGTLKFLKTNIESIEKLIPIYKEKNLEFNLDEYFKGVFVRKLGNVVPN